MENVSLGIRGRACFATCGVPTGLVENGVAYFLLIYYNQVLGLSADRVGFALLLALLFDAISDPLVGYWSDRTRSKLGRRHPFLYISILPMGFFYFLLWEPYGDSQSYLFGHLLLSVVGVRLATTFFSVPSLAMIPELTDDYDERTRLMNYLYSSGWLIGTVFAVAMYAVWLNDTPEHPNGITNEKGYRSAGRIAAVVIALSAAAMAFGSRSFIPRLQRTPSSTGSARPWLKEFRETISDISFLAVIVSSTIRFSAGGASTALWAYMQPYFWGFGSKQIASLLTAQILSAFVAFFFLPTITRNRSKRNVLISLIIVLAFVGTLPVILRLFGLFPENGSALLFPIMAFAGVVQVALIVMAGTMSGSMLMDIVEARELKTDRREEGFILSVQSFMSKVSTGVGAWIAGIMLVIVDFPSGNASTTISEEAILRLGIIYGPVLALLYATAAGALAFYRIDRDSHASSLRNLTR